MDHDPHPSGSTAYMLFMKGWRIFSFPKESIKTDHRLNDLVGVIGRNGSKAVTVDWRACFVDFVRFVAECAMTVLFPELVEELGCASLCIICVKMCRTKGRRAHIYIHGMEMLETWLMVIDSN